MNKQRDRFFKLDFHLSINFHYSNSMKYFFINILIRFQNFFPTLSIIGILTVFTSLMQVGIGFWKSTRPSWRGKHPPTIPGPPDSLSFKYLQKMKFKICLYQLKEAHQFYSFKLFTYFEVVLLFVIFI